GARTSVAHAHDDRANVRLGDRALLAARAPATVAPDPVEVDRALAAGAARSAGRDRSPAGRSVSARSGPLLARGPGPLGLGDRSELHARRHRHLRAEALLARPGMGQRCMA